jgi:superfamily II DNA or RNA helicase
MLLDLFRNRFSRTPLGLDRETALKGEKVFAAGRVLSVRESAPGRLEGEVEGSAGEAYKTTVRLAPNGAVIRVSNECTCPVAFDCKHGAALLLAWLRDLQDGVGGDREVEQAGVQASPQIAALERHQVLQWVRELRLLRWQAAGQSSRPALCYVLRSDLRRPSLHVFKARQDSDGSLHDPQPYRSMVGHVQSPPAYWDDIDLRVAALTARASPVIGGFLLDMTHARDVLLLLAGSSRLYLDRPPTPGDNLLLAPGESRQASMAWQSLAQGGSARGGGSAAGGARADATSAEPSMRLALQVEPSGEAVYTAEPCWIDRETLLIGPIETPPAPPLMAWLRAAPLVPPEAADDVALTLHAQRRARPEIQAAIPELSGHAVRERIGSPRPVLGLFAVSAATTRRGAQFGTQGSGQTAAPGASQGGSAPSSGLMAVSIAVEYEGRRIEPLRSTSLGIRDDIGPLLLICDPPAERALRESLNDSLRRLAADDDGLRFATEPATDAARAKSKGGSGWLTIATLPCASVAAARIKFELAPRLEREGWTLVDESVVPLTLVEADSVSLELTPIPAEAGDRHTGSATGAAARSGQSPAIAGARNAVSAKPEAAQADDDDRADDADQPASGPAPVNGWFELQSGIQVAGSRIDLAPVLAQVIAHGGYQAWSRSRCPDGVLWLRVSEREVLRIEAERIEPLVRVVTDWAEFGPQLSGHEGDLAGFRASMRLDAAAAAALAALSPGVALPESLSSLRALSESFEGLPAVEPPSSFKATLRPYQQQGLAWLQFIAASGTGGVLADDMGLGKTVQLLAHLECERAAGRLVRPALVVAPTSLIFNWQDEARRHAPELRVLALTGSDRAQRFDQIADHDLVLTSYALLPRDRDVLEAQRWHVVIADEAHLVKNPRTRAAGAIRALRASHRIALTGTPLENHLGELWSVMQFVVPGLLGREEAFRLRFRGPIERRGDGPEAADRLHSLAQRIRPFLLRRTKAAVLTELPARTDIIHRVELGREQRDLYESVRVAMDERVRMALAGAGLERSRVVVLDALLKLRQACCDPSLLALPAARKVSGSAKREELLNLLRTLVDEGRKVLVFSQFTSMLDRIEVALDADAQLSRVDRTRLDGDTDDRRGAVEAFQAGDARIFLLSLKAGGVGLNLTAADTVIHYDPWWNPAVEAQATDRAHRIGQVRPVFVYKLIAAGTIEERILSLQARKAELAQSVLSGALGAEGLSQEDLLGLFEPAI